MQGVDPSELLGFLSVVNVLYMSKYALELCGQAE